MMHIISIEYLEDINKQTKSVIDKTKDKELQSIFERQTEILADVIKHAEHQECKDSTMLSSDEWYYFNLNLTV